MNDTGPNRTNGMPDDLADAIGRIEGGLQRQAAKDGWRDAGLVGRQRCCDFVNAGRSDWTRRLRCQIAIRRLIASVAPWL